MKFGIRTPSLIKSIAARTSIKRVVRHNFGLKAPRGFGWFTNPKKALYNRVYNRTTFSIFKGGSLFKWILGSVSVASNRKFDNNSIQENENEISKEVSSFDPIIFLLNLGTFIVLFLWMNGVDSDIKHLYTSSYWIKDGKQNAIYNGYILAFLITLFSLMLGKKVSWINLLLYSYILYRSLIYFPSIVVTIVIGYFIIKIFFLKFDISFKNDSKKFPVKNMESETPQTELPNKKDIVDTFIDNTFQRIYDKQEEQVMKNIRNNNK